jgi:5'-phosphate synthase pdxT subunit
LGLIDIAIERNAYGRQRESFEASGEALLDGQPVPIRMVFVRAPRIRRTGAGVQTLARQGGDPVLVQEGSVLVGTFHPELTDDPTVHQYFCRMVAGRRAR